ncbi:MAG: apolipoprotein N-acyltransferase [Pseudomonadota bacterium]|nr:apolipoprotein N-acyltransferase [Pseudomonadota bacterium]
MVVSRLLPILSGLFIGTSYIPFPPWASLFCFVPLWIYWNDCRTLRQVFIGGWVTGVVLALVGFNWVAHTLHEFAYLSWFLSALGLLLYAAVSQLYIPLAGVVWFWLRQQIPSTAARGIVVMALLTALGERYSLTLFDWNFGYSWYGSGLTFYQLAELVGFSGLGTITILFNLSFYFAWQHRGQKKAIIWLVSGLVVFAGLNLCGGLLEKRVQEPDASLNVLLVQGNIGNAEKTAAELGTGFRDEIIRKYFNLTDQGLSEHQPPDLVVWPEAAFPAFIDQHYGTAHQFGALQDFLRQRKIPLVTGGFGVDHAQHKITNSLFSLDSDGALMDPHYSKTILLAFGEYVPGLEWFPFLSQWLPPIGEYARGPGPTILLPLNGYRIGPQICYESLFPEFTRGLANLGAQFIINVTNDSWYGTWQEPYQHLLMTMARAVEFRRPVIRSTNTGISTVALASGAILERSPLGREWTGLYHIPFIKNPLPTFYQKWFSLVPSILWLVLGMHAVYGVYNLQRKR